MSGKTQWKKNCGRIGKGSLVWVDGKLLVTEANGRITILDVHDEGKKPKELSKIEVPDKLGREYATYGTPAIANGRIYLQCANQTFCIGDKEAKAQSAAATASNEVSTDEKPSDPALVQVVPADAVMHPGDKKQFTAKVYDAKGRLVSQSTAEWSIGQLLMPAIPKPGQPPDPTAKPTPVGNLKGEVDGQGNFIAAKGPFQGGAIVAKVGELSGHARVRVLPPLPWKFDFEQNPLEKPPLTWTGAGGKFSVTELDGTKCLVKLIDKPGAPLSLPPKALYARARTNYGSVDMHDYTVQADVRVTGDMVGTNIFKMPDAGVIDSRYVLELQGSTQSLNIHVWQYAGPDYTSKSIPFTWNKDTWYRLKLMVAQSGDKAIMKGKAWQADQPEPDKWMIELEDPNPNRNGNPGLWGFSNEHEIFYDNIIVTSNEK
jgi:hypothetical protein